MSSSIASLHIVLTGIADISLSEEMAFCLRNSKVTELLESLQLTSVFQSPF